jgi:hypothetical protein
LWKGYKTPAGYGNTSIGIYPARAHRVSYEIFVGEIPIGLCVLHKCDNPPCVNPNHLFVGTNADNAKDMSEKGRSRYGTRSNHAKLTDDDVISIRRLFIEGVERSTLSERFKVDYSNISCILLNKTWKHIPSVEQLRAETG